MLYRLTMVAACLLSVTTASRIHANDWPAFRGPALTGISDETGVPLNWSAEKNIRWKVALPGPGNSSPVVSRDRVFVTCATDKGRHLGLYCFDRRDGRLLWERVVEYDETDPTHDTNPYCGSSPATDG